MNRKSLLIIITMVTGLSVWAQSVGLEASPVSISSAPLNARYHRPAGAFFTHITAVDGVAQYNQVSDEFIMLKPYSDYTFHALADGIGPDAQFLWRCYDDFGWEIYECNTRDLTVNNGPCRQQTPSLRVRDGSATSSFEWYNPSLGWAQVICPIMMVTAVNPSQVTDQEGVVENLLSSKSPARHSFNDHRLFATLDGLRPYGNNAQGWWLGKNASHVDGIAQAFERPTHPYLLKKVCLMIDGSAVVTGDVSLTCKVYRLDEIPAYHASEPVSLPEVPGELIAIGKGTVSPATITQKNGLVEFRLYSCDPSDPGSAQLCQPTVEYPILVVVDGYNDPEAAGLVDFTARASSNMLSDEGYGELAYVKYPMTDDEGNFSGNYEWRGLNHLLDDGREMMTGLSIYIVADHPYLRFLTEDESGEYQFDAQGGLLQRQYGDETSSGIQFLSWLPSEDEGWSMSCDGDDLPDWLEIELTDVAEDVDHYIVNARVTAQPLPKGVAYREAVVRFSYPGTYLDYKFIQGEKSYIPCGPSADGEINIADLNYLINLVLNDMYDDCYDVNSDGELNLSDVNALIDVILSW